MKVVAASRNSHMVESCHICFIYMGHVNFWPAGVFVCGKRRWKCVTIYGRGHHICVQRCLGPGVFAHVKCDIFMLMSNINMSHVANTYSQLQIGWHSILRLFLKTFNLVPDVPGFSWDLSFVVWY